MRLFVAFELPDRVREAIADALASLSAQLPPARWIPGENLHLTLAFLGEVAADGVPALHSALHRVFEGAEPHRLTLGSGGTCPPCRPARLAYVSVEGGGELAAVQGGVQKACAKALGRQPEHRTFHPHVTVARARRRWPREAVEKFLASTADLEQTWRVRRGLLVESRLHPDDARYSVVEVYPLEGPGAD